MSPFKDPEMRKQYLKEYKEKNKEKIKKQNKEYWQRPENKKRAKENGKKWREENKIKAKEYQKEYYKNNKETITLTNLKWKEKNEEKVKGYKHRWWRDNIEENTRKQKEYYKNNKEVIKEKSRKYEKENREKINKRRRVWYPKSKKNNIQFRLSERLRHRLYQALKGNVKNGSAVHDLGCTLEKLKTHLENQFQEGMAWENWKHDGWHIDHIKPLNSFDLTDREQFLEACHYTNLQPLWWYDNIEKSDKIDWECEFK